MSPRTTGSLGNHCSKFCLPPTSAKNSARSLTKPSAGAITYHTTVNFNLFTIRRPPVSFSETQNTFCDGDTVNNTRYNCGLMHYRRIRSRRVITRVFNIIIRRFPLSNRNTQTFLVRVLDSTKTNRKRPEINARKRNMLENVSCASKSQITIDFFYLFLYYLINPLGGEMALTLRTSCVAVERLKVEHTDESFKTY